ncbi:hypothetical protein KX935_00715 [Streptobacillus moniliformis]|uniref:Heat shock protein DnaJ domain protein n=1 Tax=Streptobacillus moniliformis (strain ATCC 14647 / DSM 12112 / NCTC 10651 / 9901) TaxID=519441 RepID=D1AXL8_STRM9|nr:molecular chaperone DnaJ [Streptobacillus moniliformis]ACZ01044.1 heat shock protein DnaJ domain protein [Streptobacillus moniliformis DSM 12112]AVL42588.1 hypothetical protein CEP89_01355 [Streptobacillus moniliformis]QXW65822.1 hypothetical protein KX935_00715 [Streptobacillus moniliformis]SQA13817.1 chaperone protein DnaJ [Streptobacillus moniliformis]
MRNIIAILFGLFAMSLFKKNNNTTFVGILLRIVFIVLGIMFFIPIIAFLIFAIFIGYIIVKVLGIKFTTNTYTEEDFYNFYGNRNNANFYNYNQRDDEYKKACDYLGVSTTDSFDVKKKARNTMLKKYHPDFFKDENEKEKATEITNKINNAWQIIEKYEDIK